MYSAYPVLLDLLLTYTIFVDEPLSHTRGAVCACLEEITGRVRDIGTYPEFVTAATLLQVEPQSINKRLQKWLVPKNVQELSAVYVTQSDLTQVSRKMLTRRRTRWFSG